MLYAACCVPVSPVRKEPAHRSEMTSQQLFGEKVTCLETNGNQWIKIRDDITKYEGWITRNHLVELDDKIFLDKDNAKSLSSDWVNELQYKDFKMHIPLGSRPEVLVGDGVKYTGGLLTHSTIPVDESMIRKIAYMHLNTPYLWGGRTVFGIDCSGFALAVYMFSGIQLPRDSFDQAQLGETVHFLKEAKCGDLAFFGNEGGKITHVGILLNESEIIHSSGKVRIDQIDAQGITNHDTGERTHNLRIIKRFF